MRKRGMEQHPIPIKNPLSSKQPGLISSTHKIQKSKKEFLYLHILSLDIFMPLFVLIYVYFIRFCYSLKIISGRLKHHLSLLIFILKCQRNRCNFFQWGDEVPSDKNMAWMNDTEHVGIPGVMPIPAKGYSGENLLWDQMQTYTRFSRTSTMNEIVCPPQLKGFHFWIRILI